MEIQLCSNLAGSGVDQSKFIRFGQGILKEASHKLVHKAFSTTAAINPLLIAVEHDGDRSTYAELDVASTNLSRRLMRLGLRPRDRVVLLVQRSISMVVAIFAVLKSGCQYVPIDGGVASDDALAHVLSETKAPFVLCLDRYQQRAYEFALPGTQILSLEHFRNTLTDCDADIGRTISVDADDGAYIIYTSGSSISMTNTMSSHGSPPGSTGKPKGVDVTHRNVTNLLTLAPGNLCIKPGSRVAQVLSISFDMGRS